jgi:diguanylate cyclase (GGDEF)-like protein
MTKSPEMQTNMGLIDSLTGINNRRYLDERLPTEISRSQRYKKPLSCLFIGVDQLDQFNHSYGHATGGKILKQVAYNIYRVLRTTDIMGRYGEEEFAVLLIETDIAIACEVAERIRCSIQQQRVEMEGQPVEITISIGVSGTQQIPDQSAKAVGESMLAAADKALCNAKQTGKNQVHCA